MALRQAAVLSSSRRLGRGSHFPPNRKFWDGEVIHMRKYTKPAAKTVSQGTVLRANL